MNRKRSVDDDSRTIGFRVHPLLDKWIKAQAVDGESPHQVVRRLVEGLAVGDGVVVKPNAGDPSLIEMKEIDDLINERVDRRFMALEAVMATFNDSLGRLKRDVANLKQE